jgi:hypothetical protein
MCCVITTSQRAFWEAYVSLSSISGARDTVLLVESPRKSFLRCRKDRVSVLFWSASHSVAQYVVLNTSSGEVDRWGIIAPFAEARANGFALTDDGGVFVSLVGWQNSENILRHGLYKLQATAGNPVATLILLGGQPPQSYAKIVEMLFPTARSSNCTALREMNWLSDRQAMAGGDLRQKPQHPCQVLLASGAFRTPSRLGAVTR